MSILTTPPSLKAGMLARPTFQSTLRHEYGMIESVLTATDTRSWVQLRYPRGIQWETVTVLAENSGIWEVHNDKRAGAAVGSETAGA